MTSSKNILRNYRETTKEVSLYLEALEIINAKCVDIELFKSCKCLDDYNSTLCYMDLTRREYRLLKKVFKKIESVIQDE